MLDDELISWDEGLFVRPQHLQAAQRQAVARHAAERRLLTPFPYGLVAAEADVAGGRVQFPVLHAVLRDGTVVHHGRNAAVRPFDLRDGEPTTVHLAVRRSAPHRVTAHADVPDEITGGDPAPVVGRVVDAHLIAGAVPDAVEWESMPVARVAGGRVDEQFAPPCLRLSACRPLRRLVTDVLDLARRARDGGGAASATEAMTAAEGDRVLRRRAATAFAADLSHRLVDPSLTPYAAYGLCLHLLAVVGEGRPESAFDHDDPWPAFARLRDELADVLGTAADPPRRYDLRPLDPPMPADLLGCHPEVDLVVNGSHEAVLAVAVDRPEEAELLGQVIALRNLKVAAPGALVAFQAGLLLAWQVADDSGGLPPIHAGPGATRFLRLSGPAAAGPAWQRVRAERTLAVRYPTAAAAGRRELRLRVRLYLVPVA